MTHLAGYVVSPKWLTHQGCRAFIQDEVPSKGEYLVPITINVESDGKKFQDSFLYNLYGMTGKGQSDAFLT